MAGELVTSRWDYGTESGRLLYNQLETFKNYQILLNQPDALTAHQLYLRPTLQQLKSLWNLVQTISIPQHKDKIDKMFTKTFNETEIYLRNLQRPTATPTYQIINQIDKLDCLIMKEMQYHNLLFATQKQISNRIKMEDAYGVRKRPSIFQKNSQNNQ